MCLLYTNLSVLYLWTKNNFFGFVVLSAKTRKREYDKPLKGKASCRSSILNSPEVVELISLIG